jgi:uncharacterized membrane protein
MTQEPRNFPPPAPQPGGPARPATGTSTGLDPRLSGVLAYLFWIVGGILFLATEKEHQIVRFHAAQSVVLAIVEIAVWVVFMILTAIPFLGVLFGILAAFFWLLALLLALFLMWKAYQLERYKLPLLGEYAEKLAAKQL